MLKSNTQVRIKGDNEKTNEVSKLIKIDYRDETVVVHSKRFGFTTESFEDVEITKNDKGRVFTALLVGMVIGFGVAFLSIVFH